MVRQQNQPHLMMKPLINEFRFYQKTHRNILGQKSELQRVIERRQQKLKQQEEENENKKDLPEEDKHEQNEMMSLDIIPPMFRELKISTSSSNEVKNNHQGKTIVQVNAPQQRPPQPVKRRSTLRESSSQVITSSANINPTNLLLKVSPSSSHGTALNSSPIKPSLLKSLPNKDRTEQSVGPAVTGVVIMNANFKEKVQQKPFEEKKESFFNRKEASTQPPEGKVKLILNSIESNNNIMSKNRNHHPPQRSHHPFTAVSASSSTSSIGSSTSSAASTSSSSFVNNNHRILQQKQQPNYHFRVFK